MRVCRLLVVVSEKQKRKIYLLDSVANVERDGRRAKVLERRGLAVILPPDLNGGAGNESSGCDGLGDLENCQDFYRSRTTRHTKGPAIATAARAKTVASFANIVKSGLARTNGL